MLDCAVKPAISGMLRGSTAVKSEVGVFTVVKKMIEEDMVESGAVVKNKEHDF